LFVDVVVESFLANGPTLTTSLDTSLTFPKCEALVDYMHGYGHQADYAFIIKRSYNTRAHPRVELCCDLAGEYRRRRRATHVEQQCACGTRLIGCTWKALGKQEKDGNWSPSVICNEHNHNPSTELDS
jgi:hypothetical protein